MQEEVENRTVNLAISTTRLTVRSIVAGIRKYMQHREKVKAGKGRDPAVHGKQSVKKLLGQNQGCLLYTSPSPRDPKTSRMPSSA